MRFIHCDVVVLEPEANPPWVEARFLDASGRLTVIHDKEPIFVGPDERPGQGLVRCTELHRRTDGARTIVTVSLDNPDSLETTDGRQVVDVLDSSLV